MRRRARQRPPISPFSTTTQLVDGSDVAHLRGAINAFVVQTRILCDAGRDTWCSLQCDNCAVGRANLVFFSLQTKQSCPQLPVSLIYILQTAVELRSTTTRQWNDGSVLIGAAECSEDFG